MEIEKLIGTTDNDKLKWLMYFGHVVYQSPTFELAADDLVRINRHDSNLRDGLKHQIDLAKAGLDDLYAAVLRQLNEQQTKGE